MGKFVGRYRAASPQPAVQAGVDLVQKLGRRAGRAAGAFGSPMKMKPSVSARASPRKYLRCVNSTATSRS